MAIVAYPGTTKRIKLTDLRRNGILVTGASGATVTYALTIEGAEVETGTALHDDAAPGTWYRDVVVPTALGRCHVHWLVTVAGSIERFHDSINVKAFV